MPFREDDEALLARADALARDVEALEAERDALAAENKTLRAAAEAHEPAPPPKPEPVSAPALPSERVVVDAIAHLPRPPKAIATREFRSESRRYDDDRLPLATYLVPAATLAESMREFRDSHGQRYTIHDPIPFHYACKHVALTALAAIHATHAIDRVTIFDAGAR